MTDPLPLAANQTYHSTCPERVITFTDLGNEPAIDYTTQTECDVIPPYLQASTGDVVNMFRNAGCLPGFNTTEIPSVCAPFPCEMVKMPGNSTCTQFVETLSTPNGTQATLTQFLSWNPFLLGLCSETSEQWVCAGAPGGTYIPPAVSNATTSAGSQQRGGGDGSGTATGSGGADDDSRNSTLIRPGQTPPTPTQLGIPAACRQFGLAQSGDGCDSFSSLFDITFQALVGWNPVLGANGANCQTLFFAGYYYCIGVSTATTTTSPKPASSPTASATPSPVQSGISPQCTKYAETAPGTYCSKFASDNNITPAQLYTWNPILGANGASCDTELFANYYYCVGVSATPTPSPVQSGINPKCTKYAETAPGTYCSKFASDNNIAPAQLYAWNPILGANGASCSTELFAAYYYYVGAPSGSPTSTSVAVAAPRPTQSGITSACNKYAEAASGDTCGILAQRNGITTTQLYAWNTVLGGGGANCESSLFAQEYYCVGVGS